MKRVQGSNVKVSRDAEGALLTVDWVCPYCGEWNAGFYSYPALSKIHGDFEIDHDCDVCGKVSTIECRNATELFNG